MVKGLIPRSERVCKLCKYNQCDDEMHLFECPFYNDIRIRFHRLFSSFVAKKFDNNQSALDLDGNIAKGSAKPSSEYRVHLESYRTRKDINTCIHLHPQASIFAAAIGEDIQLVTTDHLYYLRKIIRIPWIAPGTQEVAEATATALKDCNVVILENHGCVVVADNPRLAYSRALNLEEAAEMTIRSALLKVKPKLVPQEFEQYLKQQDL